MPTNRIADGDILDTVATGAVTAGWLVKRGNTLGVALNTQATTGGQLQLDVSGGVWNLDKIAAASTNMAVGGRVYSRATGSAGRHKVLGVATGSIIGTCWKAAATGDTKAWVKLFPGAM